MKSSARSFMLAACAAATLILDGCNRTPPVTCVPAPPGPADLGPAIGLSPTPGDAIVFDLKYLPQTGAADDIQYFSYWGFGGSDNDASSSSFLGNVRKQASHLYYLQNPNFKGREWAAVEHHGRQATALYFDLNANGKLDQNERIPPTHQVRQGVEFITPDFIQPLEDGGQTLCRTLVQVNFYGGSEPNCMWSPAALLEGTATLNGQAARLLLFANQPGGAFDKYGSSSYALLIGNQGKNSPQQYLPRQVLSSLISSEDQFYRLTLEGRRSNGLPARVVLVKDTSRTGALALKLVATNSLEAAFGSVFLHGVSDKTVFFGIGASKGKVSLPVGTYALDRGALTYGASNSDEWEVSFSQGPWAAIKAGEVCEVALGQPTLKIRAIDEKDRYRSQAIECATYKQGTSIYLEPRIIGKGLEAFSRFRHATTAKAEKVDSPPHITITASNGKQLLSKNLEYG